MRQPARRVASEYLRELWAFVADCSGVAPQPSFDPIQAISAEE
jgi:hypothetical protein